MEWNKIIEISQNYHKLNEIAFEKTFSTFFTCKISLNTTVDRYGMIDHIKSMNSFHYNFIFNKRNKNSKI